MTNVIQALPQMRLFLDQSPTAYQATASLVRKLEGKGYRRLFEADPWDLESGEKYYVTRNDSSLIAFHIGNKPVAEAGFKLIGAHTDSPALKIKRHGETKLCSYTRLGVEVYGGPIISTWLDRELSIAGRVAIRTEKTISSKLVDFRRPLAIIPNAAIHMNREINTGFEYNKQNHLPAILLAEEVAPNREILRELLAEEIGVDPIQIGETDLFLYDPTPAAIVGAQEEMLVSGRLDNLAMCYAIAEALGNAKTCPATLVGIFNDNEEIGSQTAMGADSTFLRDILDRITVVQGGKKDDFARALARSFLISADMAHALHPNYADKHDPNYRPLLNNGPVIKLNGNFRYATTAMQASYFEMICKEADVPCQKMMVRSDLPCGSTIGPITSALTSIQTVDVGNPMFAMHSIRETAGVKDQAYMERAFATFFQTDDVIDGEE